ncbi:MAG: HD domain-containing protein [Candidatus Aenigmarchaeota archaeon]|nr:HD domain-containing protein [Candidatus Aenigmarchaeota archaeon]
MKEEIKKFVEGNYVLRCFEDELKDAPCSKGHHLNIKGGLLIHLKHVSDIAREVFPKEKRLHFLADVHDIGKARVYGFDEKGNIIYKKPDLDHIIHTFNMLQEVEEDLTEEEQNAILMHHGGWSVFKGEMTELGVKLHFCDLLATVRENGGE